MIKAAYRIPVASMALVAPCVTVTLSVTEAISAMIAFVLLDVGMTPRAPLIKPALTTTAPVSYDSHSSHIFHRKYFNTNLRP